MARKLAQRVPYVCAPRLHRPPRHAQQSLGAGPSHLPGGQRGQWHFTLNGKPHSVRVRGLLQCNSGHALLDAAIKGIGIIQLPDYYVSDHLARGAHRAAAGAAGPEEGSGPSIPTTATSPQGAAAGGLSGRAPQRSPPTRPGSAPSAEPSPEKEKARMCPPFCLGQCLWPSWFLQQTI